ncbi:hypothetical protein KR018_009614, partial [Drosophila ironensis]
SELPLDLAYSRFVRATDYEQRLEQHERRILVGSTVRLHDNPFQNARWSHEFRVYVKALPIESNDSEKENVDKNQNALAEPLSEYVQKVVFRYSDDCSNCIHIVEKPPFQSISSCSRDSSVSITLLFRDPDHTCTIFHYALRLPESEDSGPMIHESVRTIIFVNPSEMMMKLLKLPKEVPVLAPAPAP